MKTLSKDIFQFILSLFLLSIFVFCMSRIAPGDPLKSYYGEAVERMSSSQKQDAINKLELDRPIHIQYINWLSKALKCDFGISFKYKRNTLDVIKSVYINTIILGLTVYILLFFLSLNLGIFCSMNEGKWIDIAVCKIGNTINSIPSFWISLILILIFSVNLKLLPSSGAYSIGKSQSISDRILHLVLPTTVLVIGHMWYYAYMVRNKLYEEVRKDYIFIAKMKGFGATKIMYTHCVRNIMPSYISTMTVAIPHILGSIYIVEKVFSYSGLGTLCFESAKYHDYNMLMILTLITGTVVIISNIVAQSLNKMIDGRLKDDI